MHEYEYVGMNPGYPQMARPMMVRQDVVGIQPGGLSEIVGVGYPLQEIVGVGYPAFAPYPYAAGQRGIYNPHAHHVRGFRVGPGGQFVGQDLSGPTAQVVGPQVAAVQPRNVREFAIGFGPTNPAVNPNTTVIVAAQPQILFRGSRLVIPSSYGSNAVAQNFLINDIRVGKDSQFVSAGPLPGLAYLETAVGTAMGLDTCNVGQLITLNVTNLDMTNAHTFYATMFGTSVQ
jgi:hypothetical protein